MAQQATITAQDGGLYLIHGEMSFSSVNQLLIDSQACFKSSSMVVFDLAGVQQADSAGVALLVEWFKLAKQQQKPLQFLNIPLQMRAIVEVSDLIQHLPITED